MKFEPKNLKELRTMSGVLLRELPISKQLFDAWTKKAVKPSDEKIKLFCDFFNITEKQFEKLYNNK